MAPEAKNRPKPKLQLLSVLPNLALLTKIEPQVSFSIVPDMNRDLLPQLMDQIQLSQRRAQIFEIWPETQEQQQLVQLHNLQLVPGQLFTVSLAMLQKRAIYIPKVRQQADSPSMSIVDCQQDFKFAAQKEAQKLDASNLSFLLEQSPRRQPEEVLDLLLTNSTTFVGLCSPNEFLINKRLQTGRF